MRRIRKNLYYTKSYCHFLHQQIQARGVREVRGICSLKACPSPFQTTFWRLQILEFPTQKAPSLPSGPEQTSSPGLPISYARCQAPGMANNCFMLGRGGQSFNMQTRVSAYVHGSAWESVHGVGHTLKSEGRSEPLSCHDVEWSPPRSRSLHSDLRTI